MSKPRRALIAEWLKAIATEEWIDTMAGVGEFQVKKRLDDGTRVHLIVREPSDQPPRTRKRTAR